MKDKSKKTNPRIPAVEVRALLASGETLLANGELPAAIAQLQRAVALDPACEAARYALGCAWLEAGEAARAIEILSPLLSSTAYTALAAEKIAAAQTMDRAGRSAAPYIRHLFDQVSPDYDRIMLEELHYRAHVILRDLADMLIGAEPRALDVLDLGCGTGLAGDAFRDLARRLDGVDLSPGMIEKARTRGIYDTLAVADVESIGVEGAPLYDLILAADAFVYFGELTAVFRAAAMRLKTGGFFLFTVEANPGAGYELGPKRRYRHSEAYLREEATRAKLEVMGVLACSPRHEAVVPVDGFAVALQRS